jgi:hypothetical protein
MKSTLPSYFESSAPQHMILIIGQGLGRCDNDRISCMRAKWVEVLHVAAYNRVLDKGRTRLVNERWTVMKRNARTSAPSRTTSYSTSFQPFILRSTRTCGESARPRAARSRSSSGLFANPEPSPPRVKAERMMTGYPIFSAAVRAALTEDTAVDCATGMSISERRN